MNSYSDDASAMADASADPAFVALCRRVDAALDPAQVLDLQGGEDFADLVSCVECAADLQPLVGDAPGQVSHAVRDRLWAAIDAERRRKREEWDFAGRWTHPTFEEDDHVPIMVSWRRSEFGSWSTMGGSCGVSVTWHGQEVTFSDECTVMTGTSDSDGVITGSVTQDGQPGGSFTWEPIKRSNRQSIAAKPTEEVFTRFYRGEGPDRCGRYIDDIHKWDDEQLEATHDYIQWLFPTDKESDFNGLAPDFPQDLQRRFRADDTIAMNLRRSFDVYCKFLGLRYVSGRAVCERMPEFFVKSANWLEVRVAPNHNWLRISRVLHCLRLMEETERRVAFYDALESIYAEGYIQSRFADTVQFWQHCGGFEGRPIPKQEQRSC